MPRPCITCKHPDREQIDYDLLRGITPKTIAARPGLPHEEALKRHKRSEHHLTPELTARRLKSLVAANKDWRMLELDERQTWLMHIRRQRHELINIQEKLREQGQHMQAAQVAPTILRAQELIARWLGELINVNRTTVRQEHVLITDPAWPILQRGLSQLCQRHPEIKGEVIDLLREMEAATPAGPKLGELAGDPTNLVKWAGVRAS